MHDSSVSWPNAIDVFCNLHALASQEKKKQQELETEKWRIVELEIQKHKQNDKINSINRSERNAKRWGCKSYETLTINNTHSCLHTGFGI